MRTFSYDEVHKATLDFFNGDVLAADVFVSKYALHDPTNNVFLEKTPGDMHRRIAREFARIEAKYVNPMSEDEILGLLAELNEDGDPVGFGEVIPQGSPMSAIGNPFQVQSLSNCFVIDSPCDSYGGIFKVDEEEAQIMKRRGGVGFDVSTIRPTGLPTSNAAKTTDGLGVFMERFSHTCREVAQGGRRGALMMTCSIHHPEIRTFINIKRDRKKVTGANVSVALTDEFMCAVRDKKSVQLRWPVDPGVPHVVEEWVDAEQLWDELISSAHDCAEPGVLFWDTWLRNSPADAYASLGFRTVSTNPCAELGMNSYDSCRLTLVNLLKFVIDAYLPSARFDWERFKHVVVRAQRLMDDLVDLELEAIERILKKIESDPEPDDVKSRERELWLKIYKKTSNGRRTGLGPTALGDCIAALGIKYGSQESIEATERIYRALAVASYASSCTLAAERGAFPVFSHELEREHPFVKRVIEACGDELRELYKKFGRRNIANLTTSPAGSTSIETQTTSGIEPETFLEVIRKRKVHKDDTLVRVDEVDETGDAWQRYAVYSHGVKRWMAATGGIDPKQSPYSGATCEEIDWVASVDLQAAAQRWVCHGISKTCNLPADISVDVVKQVYMRAWEAGCKGFTVYRKGSRNAVIADAASSTTQSNERPDKLAAEHHAPKRKKELPCDVHKVTMRSIEHTEAGVERTNKQWLVLVGLLDDRPYEVFAGLAEQIDVPRKAKRGVLVKNGKVNGVATYNLRLPIGDDDELVFKNVVDLFDNGAFGALTRTLSLALRHGVPVQYVVEQLLKNKDDDMSSFSRVVARVLKGYIPDGTKSSEKSCPVCKSDGLVYQEGCVMCRACGFSKCG